MRASYRVKMARTVKNQMKPDNYIPPTMVECIRVALGHAGAEHIKENIKVLPQH